MSKTYGSIIQTYKWSGWITTNYHKWEIRLYPTRRWGFFSSDRTSNFLEACCNQISLLHLHYNLAPVHICKARAKHNIVPPIGIWKCHKTIFFITSKTFAICFQFQSWHSCLFDSLFNLLVMQFWLSPRISTDSKFSFTTSLQPQTAKLLRKKMWSCDFTYLKIYLLTYLILLFVNNNTFKFDP